MPKPDEQNPENNGPWFGPVYKTSDSFQNIYDCAIELIKSGDAYVDSLSAEEMREFRGTLTEPGKDSPFRNRSVEENLELFQMVNHFFFNVSCLMICCLFCTFAFIFEYDSHSFFLYNVSHKIIWNIDARW